MGSPKFLPNGDLAWVGAGPSRLRVRSLSHRCSAKAGSGAVRALTAAWDRSVDHLERTSDDGRDCWPASRKAGSACALRSRSAQRTGPPPLIVGAGEVARPLSTAGEQLVEVAWRSLGAPPDLYGVPIPGGGEARATHRDECDALLERRCAQRLRAVQLSQAGTTSACTATSSNPMVSKHRCSLSGRLHHPRWPAVEHGKSVELPLEPAAVFRRTATGSCSSIFTARPVYGQAFTDSINQDWGGKPLEDLQKGLAAALARYHWLDW